jgi:hypothetical protein
LRPLTFQHKMFQIRLFMIKRMEKFRKH